MVYAINVDIMMLMGLWLDKYSRYPVRGSTQSGELDLYDKISDAQPEGQGHSILILFIAKRWTEIIWYYIGLNKYSRYPIGFIWYYIGLNKYSRYPIGFIW